MQFYHGDVEPVNVASHLIHWPGSAGAARQTYATAAQRGSEVLASAGGHDLAGAVAANDHLHRCGQDLEIEEQAPVPHVREIVLELAVHRLEG